jgi:mxaJ protein
MCLRFLRFVGFVMVSMLATLIAPRALAQTTRPGVLVVVEEPNNLPFSNDRLEGFENKIAELVAQEMGMKLEYRWRALRRGYFRETIKAGEADLVMGVPRDLDMALTTEPYYRSSYVFVRRSGSPTIASFDDPALKHLRVGVPLTGDSNPPPAIELGRRGIIDNVAGYTVFGNYAQPNPPARLIEAVANGEIEVAIAWGPLAGYFAKIHGLVVTPVAPSADAAGLPMAFEVSMGVAKKNRDLRERLNEVLKHRHDDIERILNAYAVPRARAAAAVAVKHRPDAKSSTREEVPGCCE